ncbi:MAG: redoxin domain-containing protein [Flavobacteriales bacterium]|jgi:hypothetical protein|nr:redoxin domain-containing protein [Flavobacteriales bacterium]
MRLITLFFFSLAVNATSQTVTNFNIDDIDGVNRDLFAELDDANVVVLKFFTNWCGICNNTADDVVAIYNGYQPNGDPVVFWALDRDPNETNVHATTYRDNNNIPFPVIGEAYSVAQQFGVLYQPEYYIIRPDRSYVKKTSYGTMNTAVDEALASLATGIGEGRGLQHNLLLAENNITWFGSSTEQAELKMFDTSGRVVYDDKIGGGEKVTLDLSIGVYIYRLVDAKGATSTGKIGIAK